MKHALSRRARRAVPLLSLIAPFAFASACGGNPYADSPKKCKLACEAHEGAKGADAPRKTQPVPMGLAFWNENVGRTPLDKGKLDGLLSINPFLLLDAAVRTEGRAAEQAVKLAGKETSDAARCHVAAFAKPSVADGEARRIAADYGRCVPLNLLSDALNEKAGIPPRSKERWKMGQWEAAVSATLPPASALVESAAALVRPGNAADWLRAFPYAPIRPSDVRRDATGAFAPLPFTFLAASMETREVWKGDEKAQSIRTSRMNGGGSNVPAAIAPVTAVFGDDGKSLRLNGSITSALANVLDPRDDSDHRGRTRTGLTLEFQFADFTLRGEDLELDGRLGFRPDVALDGIYFLYVNDAFGTPISQRKAFPMWAFVSLATADGRPLPCKLARMRRDSASQEEWVDEGEVDICGSN